MYRLKNAVQHYQWGGGAYIPELLGYAPDADKRYAELWMGAHPRDSSRVQIDGGEYSLFELVRAEPRHWLGERGGDFPFLLKVLSIAHALSIQVHPNAEQAAEGYRREEGRVAADDPARLYKDAQHKPELMCALTHCWALCGLRSPAAIAQEYTRPYYDTIRDMVGTPAPFKIRYHPGGAVISNAPGISSDSDDAVRTVPGIPSIQKFLRALFDYNERPEKRSALLRACADYAIARYPDLPDSVAHNATPPAAFLPLSLGGQVAGLPPLAPSSLEDMPDGAQQVHDMPEKIIYWWVLKLMQQFPDDLGALAPLYLNIIALQPGQGLYIGAQTLHAYLHGNGIEIMANSDNVLRGGLTAKHVDSAELLKIIEYPLSTYHPTNGEVVYRAGGSDGRAARRAGHSDAAERATHNDSKMAHRAGHSDGETAHRDGHTDDGAAHRAGHSNAAERVHNMDRANASCVREYNVPVSEFKLCVIRLGAQAITITHAPAPKILFCTEGQATVCDLTAVAGAQKGHETTGERAAADSKHTTASNHRAAQAEHARGTSGGRRTPDNTHAAARNEHATTSDRRTTDNDRRAAHNERATELTIQKGQSLVFQAQSNAISIHGKGTLYMAIPAGDITYHDA